MLKIILADKNNLEEATSLFDQYRVFYQMPSNIRAAEVFISTRLTQQDSLIFIGYNGNIAVSFMQIYHSFSSVAMQPIWILNDLYVEASARRKGHAKEMMIYLGEKAKQKKVFSIKLATAITNHGAKKLYQSLGYHLNENFHHYSKRINTR